VQKRARSWVETFGTRGIAGKKKRKTIRRMSVKAASAIDGREWPIKTRDDVGLPVMKQFTVHACHHAPKGETLASEEEGIQKESGTRGIPSKEAANLVGQARLQNKTDRERYHWRLSAWKKTEGAS